MLLAVGILCSAPTYAYDSDDDGDDKPRKSSKKKKKSKKTSSDDYWDEDSWDEEPVSKKKKSKKKSRKKSRKKVEEDDEDDSWDDEDDQDKNSSSDDAEDFFSDDAPAPAPAPALEGLKKTAFGSVAVKPAEQPKPASAPKSAAPALSPRDACVEKMIHNPSSVDHIEFVVVHPRWCDPVRINKQHKVMVHMSQFRQKATVLELTERELRVKWDNFGEERFLRQPDNRYVHESIVKKMRVRDNRKVNRVASRLRSRKAIPWEEYGWSGWLMDYISGNEPPLTYHTFRLVHANLDCKVRFSKDEMALVRMDGDHEAATVLGYTGVKLHVQWGNGSVETYKRMEDGTYRKIDDERVAKQLADSNLAVREKAEDDWFQIWWRDIMDEEKPLSYVNIELKEGKDDTKPRICMDNRLLVNASPHEYWAKVVKFDRKELIIRPYNKEERHFERGDDNVYRCTD